MLQLVMGMAEKDTTTNWTTATFWPCSVYLSGKYASSMFWHIIKYGSYKNRAGFTPSGHISARGATAMLPNPHWPASQCGLQIKIRIKQLMAGS